MMDMRRRERPPEPKKRSSHVLRKLAPCPFPLSPCPFPLAPLPLSFPRGDGPHVPGSTDPAPVQPVVETLFGIGTHDAVGLVLEEPLDAGKKLVVEARVRQGPPDELLGVDLPGFGEDHEIQLSNDLLVLRRVRPPNLGNALLGADKEKAPVWRDDGHHVEDVGDQMSQRSRLDQEGQLRGIVGIAGVMTGCGPVDLD